MTLRIVGAGLGRTGTSSLKLALEHLLGGPCYHMREVHRHPEHIPVWHAAANGKSVDWHGLFNSYRAAVDWPAASFWRELCEAFPDAVLLLSLRDAESWWRSASATIFHPDNYVDRDSDWYAMWVDILRHRFTVRLDDREACIAAFHRHNEEVRRNVRRERLLEWRAGDGWEPLCRMLDLPVPEEPFPHTNTTNEFLESMAKR